METLSGLEALLTEFYSPIADSARKKEIDKLLMEFSVQPLAWKSCLAYVSNPTSDHVLMFCLKVIEIAVCRQCMNFSSEDKVMIRSNCYNMLMTCNTLSFYVRNKLMKLIVTIARFDWPHSYPNFLVEINELLSMDQHMLLGLNFLAVASEEFGSFKEDVSSKRRGELIQLFKSNIPALLHKVTGILREARSKIEAMSTELLSTANGPLSGTSLCIENGWVNILKSSLECTNCLLDWLEPGRNGRDAAESLQSLFDVIVELATTFMIVRHNLHCCPSRCRLQVAEVALDCICEVLSGKLCPKLFISGSFPSIVSGCHHRIRQLLVVLVGESQNVFSYLNEGRYLSKLIEYLHLFAKNNAKNLAADSDFFRLLIKFTFEQQPITSLYVSCLSMWADIFGYLNHQKMERFQDSKDMCSRYKSVVLEVADKVLFSIQFKNSQSHLESLDDDVLDDDFKTEWQNYLLENTKVVLKASKLYPGEVLTYLNRPFEEASATYFELGNYVVSVQNHVSNHAGRQLMVTAENDCKKLHCVLRDLSTFLHFFAALADNFISSSSDDSGDLETGFILFQRLSSIMDYSSKMRFHEVNSAIKNILELDFIEVHAQSLVAVKAWCPFVGHLKSDPSKWAALGHNGDPMVSSMMHSLLPLFQIEMLPEKILLSASQLLLSFVMEVQPSLIDPIFHSLFSNGITMTTAPPKAQILTYRALFMHLVNSMPTQRLATDHPYQDQHKRLLREFCNFLFRDYSEVCRAIGARSDSDVIQRESANASIQRCMEVMTEIVLGLSGTGSKKLEVCYLFLVQYIEQSVNVLHFFIGKKETSCKVMGFFFVIIQTFRTQMGAELISNVFSHFQHLFSENLVMDSLKEEESHGHELIEKLLQISEILVKDGSSQIRALLPKVLDLCLRFILPAIAERTCPTIKPALFNLFFSILKFNGNFFFPNSFNSSTSKNNLTPENQALYQEYFAIMMRAYDASLLQPDVELARQIIDQFEKLNKQFNFYSKPAFKDQFLMRFMFLLMSALIHKIHQLLREEIIEAIFNMAIIDLHHFHQGFIPQLLHSFPLRDEHSRFLITSLSINKDLPSFAEGLRSFVADLRFFLNAAGSPDDLSNIMGP